MIALAPRRVRLLVCGGADRGDDGAPLSAVAGLLSGLPPHLLAVLEVRRCEQLRLTDLLDVPPSSACVIVDAVTGVPVGEILTLPLADLPNRAHPIGLVARSTHELPLGELVALAQGMREASLVGSFVGIGGRSFGFGRALGRVVRAAMPAYRSAIETALIDAAVSLERHTV